MDKPLTDGPGTGLHIHLSIRNSEGKNIFNGNDVCLDETK